MNLSTKEKYRNTAIEALRFLFMLQICCWHNTQLLGTMQSGYLGVEFFFILSGFFIYKSAVKQDAPTILEFTFKRLSKFYVAYALSILIAAIVHYPIIEEAVQQGNYLSPVFKMIAELLMIQGFNLTGGGFNAPLWFFSVLIYGGLIVYASLKYYKNFCIRIAYPVFLILFFSILFSSDKTRGLENWSVIYGMPMSYCRGVTDMMIGVFLGYIYQNYYEILSRHRRLLEVFVVLSAVLYIAIVFSNENYAKYALIFISFIIIGAVLKNSLFSKVFSSKLWIFLGNLTYPMFVIHMIYKPVSNLVFIDILHFPPTAGLLAYIVTLLPISYIYLLMCNSIQSKLDEKKLSYYKKG